jgi:hypothetical protein
LGVALAVALVLRQPLAANVTASASTRELRTKERMNFSIQAAIKQATASRHRG